MYKRLLLALALLSSVPLAHAQDSKPSLKALDEKNGFRDYHMGDDFSKFKNLKKDEEEGDTKFYTNTSENLKIGDADLQDISYGFYKGKLYFILVRTKGQLNSDKVRAALEAQYGKGYQSNRYMEKYYWFGDKVTLAYDENSLNHDATIIFSDKAISAQKAEDKKQSAKKAGSDL